jgi:hypothetical protein
MCDLSVPPVSQYLTHVCHVSGHMCDVSVPPVSRTGSASGL